MNISEYLDYFDLSFSSQSTAVALIDSSLRIIRFNNSASKLYGYKDEEALGKSLLELSNFDNEKTTKTFTEIFNHKGCHYEFKQKSKLGNQFYVSINSSIVEIAHTKYALLIINDNTKYVKLHKSQTRLSQSEKFVKSITAGTPDIIYIYSVEAAKNIYSNRSLSRMLGYSENELSDADDDFFLKVIHPDDLAQFDEFYRIIPNWEPDFIFSFEYRMRTKHGEWRWFKGTEKEFERGADGKVLNFIGTVQEITEKKIFEEELIRSKEKAEESDKLKTIFLANMTHEIKTPMNAILGYSKLLKLSDLTTEEMHEYIDLINRRGNDLLRIINDVLDISKIETNHLSIHLDSCDVNDLLNDVYNMRKYIDQFEHLKDVEFIIGKQLAPNTIVMTDYARLQQILCNLLINALKFTERGTVEFGCEIIESNLRFYVRDTGIGIPPERHKVIFERFRQGEDVYLNRKHEGTGLGLSICKGLLQLMNGEIWVESTPCVGSTFYFTIPFLKDNSQPLLDCEFE